MAKKISKHSRAARRGEVDVSTGEARDLEKVPRLEKTDTIGPMIRASASKNESLLRQKMEKKAAKSSGAKAKASAISKAVKTRRKKALIIDGRLGSKIEASINRAKEIKSTRKSGWDAINKDARASVKGQSTPDNKKNGADHYESDQSDWEDMDEEEDEPKAPLATNAFSVLEEVEA
ncbi:hypothetical protein OGAPHI_004874 [Ogataea philodendri]|uniref:Alb1-domain-containing protein n=1 Tax=Ogataea philodendri TaxID=1378263 RepID=A0A9P8T3M7_9ASCO|nr:uncharacterized protein OGAPHI_004874 [Ogataea philodendri]KAH3664160.1 hypothetical protein OGAPHI_004874 [Ogataea philodendri]